MYITEFFLYFPLPSECWHFISFITVRKELLMNIQKQLHSFAYYYNGLLVSQWTTLVLRGSHLFTVAAQQHLYDITVHAYSQGCFG